jgi:hypothetical protein
LGAGIAGYYKTRHYDRLSEGTRGSRRGILERFREWDGDKPLAGMRRRDIIERRI